MNIISVIFDIIGLVGLRVVNYSDILWRSIAANLKI